jgi:phage shock protein C
MYCNQCGKGIQDDANVCAYCGARISGALPRKELVRPRHNRRIAGVCAGLAEYMSMDVTLMRLLWAIVAVMTGIFPGLIAYVVAWIIMPESNDVVAVPATQQPVTHS